LAKDLFDPLLVVETSDPDLRTIGQLDEEIRLVEPDAQRGEAELQDLRQRVRPNRRLGVVEAEAEDDVARAMGVNGALNKGPGQHEGFARSRPAAQHDVASWACEKPVSFPLLLR